MSVQGRPRPSRIYLHRCPKSPPEAISSTGYYEKYNGDGPKLMTKVDLARAFAIADQFKGYSVPSPREYSGMPPCCDTKHTYFEYQEVRLPLHFAPQLCQLFDKYASD